MSDRFGQSLAGLGVEVRRAVVGELTQAGLSTRAIAPVVGASQSTVRDDVHAIRSQVSSSTHLTQTPAPSSEGEAGAERDTPPAPRPAVVGIDGKTYTPPGSSTQPNPEAGD